MSHQPNRQFNNGGHYSDTTFTKIFVGGLAWETQRDAMRSYFEEFGEILEAVVIADKNTGRSKGYGFVTFKDPESAMRACQNPAPVIDGRRANCNLASLGAHKPRPTTPHSQQGRFRAPQAYHNNNQSSASTYFHQPTGQQYPFPYSAYSYGGYSQDSMNPMNYYGVYGGQHFSPYLTGSGMYHNYFPYYAQNSQAQPLGYNVQYPHFVQMPYSNQPYNSTGILSLPFSTPTISANAIRGTEATNTGPTVSQAASSEQNSSSN